MSEKPILVRRTPAWYAPGGALVVNDVPPGLTLEELHPAAQAYYKRRYLIAESMDLALAKTVSDALGLDFQGRVE